MTTKQASKVTLADLRREAKRVGLSASDTGEVKCEGGVQMFVFAENIEVRATGRQPARQRMLQLLRALPDGAMKP